MAFRSAVGTSLSTASGSATMPTGVVANDQLLAIVNADSSGDTFTFAGWTQIVNADLASPDGESIRIFTRVATGSEGASQAISMALGNPTHGWGVIIGAWSGRNTSALTSANCVTTSNTSSNTSPISMSATGVTAAGGDDIAAFFGMDNTTQSIAWAFSTATGFTNQVSDAASGVSYGNDFQSKDNVSAGATGSVAVTATGTGTGNAGWAGIVVKIPAAATSTASIAWVT